MYRNIITVYSFLILFKFLYIFIQKLGYFEKSCSQKMNF